MWMDECTSERMYESVNEWVISQRTLSVLYSRCRCELDLCGCANDFVGALGFYWCKRFYWLTSIEMAYWSLRYQNKQMRTMGVNGANGFILWQNPAHEMSTIYYSDVILSAMASQINSLTIVYSTLWFRCRSKKTSKLRVTGPCEGNSPVAGEFPAQSASNTENVSISWRHHVHTGSLEAAGFKIGIVWSPTTLWNLTGYQNTRQVIETLNLGASRFHEILR